MKRLSVHFLKITVLFSLCFLLALHPAAASETAVVTFVSNHEQERSVKAMIDSIRIFSGPYNSCKVYVVTTDPLELPCTSLEKDVHTEVMSLEMDSAYRSYPLALKAFAAAQVEKKVKGTVDTLVWLDPGVLVLQPFSDLDLGKNMDVSVRPVTLANRIGISPESTPDEYWGPIYAKLGLDYKKLLPMMTIADQVPIQPYYNCEIFSFKPQSGLAQEWMKVLKFFLDDKPYQESVCTSFLRKLFLHQAVLSAVISSKFTPERIRSLPLYSGYPFSQHDQLSAEQKASSFDELKTVIFDTTWSQSPGWMKKIPIGSSLKSRLFDIYLRYLEIAPRVYRLEGSCNSYLVITDEGSVLIDPAGSAAAPAFFHKLLETHPLKAILLTHAHRDHSDDIGKWRAGRDIPVIAQEEFPSFFEYSDELSDFFKRRNAIWAGKLPEEPVHETPMEPEERPNLYFSKTHQLVIGNTTFQMIHTPGETPDQTTIWIPELSAVFVGDNYYEYFINNSTFRGTMIRPVSGYIQAIEKALSFDPHYFLMGHGTPLLSRKEVRDTAGTFLEALKYVYEETIKRINSGKDVHTIMQEVKLPERFGIGQYYGKVEWTVRGIWQEYVGWFDENPATMYSEPFSDLFGDLAELAGPEKVIARAKDYLEQKQFVKVLHLTDIILGQDPGHREANQTRLNALKGLKAGTYNYIERIWLNYGIRLCERNLNQN